MEKSKGVLLEISECDPTSVERTRESTSATTDLN